MWLFLLLKIHINVCVVVPELNPPPPPALTLPATQPRPHPSHLPLITVFDPKQVLVVMPPVTFIVFFRTTLVIKLKLLLFK